MVRLRFGPAGKPVSLKNIDLIRIPEKLREMGLDAMEYEAVRGVKINEEKAKLFGEEARRNDILLSLHAPYFINLASAKEKTIENSIKRLNASIQAANWMGAYVVVFHPGYYKDASSYDEALKRVIQNLEQVVEFRKKIGAENVWLGPETTGKISQVGSLDEVIEICRNVDGTRPVIDWAHLHARSMGEHITSIDHVINVIEKIEKELGTWAVKPLHMHFSRIEYGKGGERVHHILDDMDFGPEFEHVCRGVVETGVDGVFISESPILEKDALVMKKICMEVCGVKCFANETKEKG